MSAGEACTTAAPDHDRTRVPIGVEIIPGYLCAGGRGPSAPRGLDAVEAMFGRHLNTGVLTRLLADGGPVLRGRFVPSDPAMQGDGYFDGHRPLHPAWRRGDSL